MAKATVKVDKRSKAYRDLHKSLQKDLGKVVLQKKVSPHLSINQLTEVANSFVGPSENRSHQEQINQLRDWCTQQDTLINDLFTRMSQLETKVG